MSEGAHRRLELLSTVLLALATVATAWSAYQSRQWTGEQSQGYSKATASRIAVNRFAALAGRQVQIDVATFIQWVNAHEEHRPDLARFYRVRFRDEFKPAFAAWLATRPFTAPSAPETPFAMRGYQLKASSQADRLEAKARRFPSGENWGKKSNSVEEATLRGFCCRFPSSNSTSQILASNSGFWYTKRPPPCLA